MTTTKPQASAISSLNLALIRAFAGSFTTHSACHMLYQIAPAALGLIEKAVFDTITGATLATPGVPVLVALYLSVGLAQLTVSFPDIWYAITFKRRAGLMLRHNLLAAQLRRPGALPPPVAPGEAIGRYDDDVAEVCDFPTWLPHVTGEMLMFLIAVIVMASIDLTITLVVVLPLFAVIGIVRAGWTRLLAAWEANRSASDQVIGFLGEVFGAVQAVKVAGSAQDVIQRLHDLGHQRRRAAVRARLLHEFMFSLYDIIGALAVGMVLLLAGQRMSAGTFSVGDFALFVYYMAYAAGFPSLIGSFIGDYNQQAVSITRLAELTPDEPQTLLQPIRKQGASQDARSVYRATGSEILAVENLTYRHQSSGRGIQDISFSVERGSLTVITGRIGSGKTTLLRVILGLLPRDSGEVRWYGTPVDDPATFMTPPHAAYTAQTPRLFSATLRENIALGAPLEGADLTRAVHIAVLDADIAMLENGLDTMVGPRGVRLSGGQVQRAAAARMLVRKPELLVVDDLSSALDVETEATLWQRLTGIAGDRRATILAVSHRRTVLQRADRIIVLRDGQVAAIGALATLLASCDEMRRLWDIEEGEGNKSLSE